MAVHVTNRIRLAVLHGSRATGRAHKNSDWDIAVLGERKLGSDEKMALFDRFAKQFGAPVEKIDIVDLRVAAPLLQFQVAKNGELLEGSPADFLNYKIFAWKHYWETKKFHKFREQFLTARFGG